MVKTANEIYRDFETNGVPASGPHKPIKIDIREWGTSLETGIASKAPSANPTFSGTVTAPLFRATATGPASGVSTTHAIQAGPTSGINLAIDTDGLQGRNNGVVADVGVNTSGGTISLGNAAVPSIVALNFGQLQFPATQNPSSDVNTLDDYETGTFTPIIIGITTAGVGTYSVQVGKYTKIGRLVFIELAVTWSAHTGTGTIRIDGLPFRVSNSSSATGPPMSGNSSNFTYVGELGFRAVQNSTLIQPTSMTSGGTFASVALDTAATFGVAGCYQV